MRLIYWMHPLFFALLWASIAVLTFLTPRELYLLLMRSEKVYTLDHLLVTILALLIFALFILIGMSSVARSPTQNHDFHKKMTDIFANPLVLKACLAFFALVSLAYIVWFGPTLNPSTLAGFFSGSLKAREVGNQVSGLTTMTQFGVGLSCIATYGALYSANLNAKRIYRFIVISLFICALYRSFLWSERLALIETVVPISIVLLAYYNRGQKLFLLMPVIGICVVVAYFGLAEYFRSWNFYKDQDIGMLYFATTRFLSYYLSSFNNLGMMIDNLEPTFEPLNSLRFLYKMPLPGFESLNQKAAQVWVVYKEALAAYTNPEFNLFSGIGMVVSDFGIAGGLMVLTVHGFLSGRLYAMMVEGRLFGVFFYPVWMVGLMEFGRLLYWGNTRAFPAWLLLFTIVFIAKSVYVRTVQIQRARGSTPL
ncbi:O-antigen polymerase [Epibacterium ulvae]|uniref:O-antigen polymerase n=1 Tax=Epibacterium ulvae TaxID=1156985 RepID=UPI00249160E9|nr:O-antigen polymerase [Epibacterium ulvae]